MGDGTRIIRCCACGEKVEATLVAGAVVYPRRPDLSGLNFWRCGTCKNFIGCHKGTTRPLGIIPTPELKKARMAIHALIDPWWKGGRIKRSDLYERMSQELGWKYHTACIRDVEEARKVYSIARGILRTQSSGGQ